MFYLNLFPVHTYKYVTAVHTKEGGCGRNFSGGSKPLGPHTLPPLKANSFFKKIHQLTFARVVGWLPAPGKKTISGEKKT